MRRRVTARWSKDELLIRGIPVNEQTILCVFERSEPEAVREMDRIEEAADDQFPEFELSSDDTVIIEIVWDLDLATPGSIIHDRQMVTITRAGLFVANIR